MGHYNMTNQTQIRRFKDENDANAFLSGPTVECIRIIPTAHDIVVVYRDTTSPQ